MAVIAHTRPDRARWPLAPAGGRGWSLVRGPWSARSSVARVSWWRRIERTRTRRLFCRLHGLLRKKKKKVYFVPRLSSMWFCGADFSVVIVDGELLHRVRSEQTWGAERVSACHTRARSCGALGPAPAGQIGRRAEKTTRPKSYLK